MSSKIFIPKVLNHSEIPSYLCRMQKSWYGENTRLGMVGGGQLGRMFIQEAINYNVHVHVLDPDPNAPCRAISHSFSEGSLTDFDTLYNFGLDKDVITVEIEHVNIDALEALEKLGKRVFPQPRILRIIQDKGTQKEFYRENNIPTAEFILLNDHSEIQNQAFSFPFVQKLRTGGYDGRGVQVLRTPDDLEKSFHAPSVIEKLIPFQKELSVIVARNETGEITAYPSVECEFHPEANLVEFLFAPSEITPELEHKARELAISVITKLNMVGILAVEMFLTHSGEILVNEIAPRPHNSGHHTIECNVTSQFEQHLRSILNLPLGSTQIIQAGAMINLLGENGYEGPAIYDGLEEVMKLPGVHAHIYGKSNTKSFRKMGHVTIAGTDISEVKKTAIHVKEKIRVIA